jgi:hypothetical protein
VLLDGAINGEWFRAYVERVLRFGWRTAAGLAASALSLAILSGGATAGLTHLTRWNSL